MGWRDLKIAVVQKRPTAAPATAAQWESRDLPEATARLMWTDITAAKRFRRGWWARLRRLGLPAMAECRQTLDILHDAEHIAAAGQRFFGKGTAAATTFQEHDREFLLEAGWNGVCRLVGEELARKDTPRRRTALDRMLDYFISHINRLDYYGTTGVRGRDRQRRGRRVGLRLKARGVRWRHKNARAMTALNRCRHTDQWNLFWSHAA